MEKRDFKTPFLLKYYCILHDDIKHFIVMYNNKKCFISLMDEIKKSHLISLMDEIRKSHFILLMDEIKKSHFISLMDEIRKCHIAKNMNIIEPCHKREKYLSSLLKDGFFFRNI